MEKLAFSINGYPITGVGGVPTGGLIISGSGIMRLIIEYLYAAVVILAVIFLIWGGINWITSGGDKQRIAQARQKIIFAIVGLIIAFLAYAIINFIGYIFGVDLMENGAGSSGPRRAYIQKAIPPNLASNWHLTSEKMYAYY